MSVLERIRENRKRALDLISQGAVEAAANYVGENVIFWKHGDPMLLRGMAAEADTDAALARQITDQVSRDLLTTKYRSAVEYLDNLVALGCDEVEEQIQAITLAAQTMYLSEFPQALDVDVESPGSIAQRVIKIFGGKIERAVNVEKSVVRNNPIYVSIFRIAGSPRTKS